MFYNTKMEVLSGSMEHYAMEQQRHQKPYQLYQGDEMVFESVHKEEIQEEIDDMLCAFLENKGMEVNRSIDEKTWNDLQQQLNIRIVH